MASSTFEVIENENESEKEISFGLEACEENGLLQAEMDFSKEHSYSKDHNGPEGEVEKESNHAPLAKNVRGTRAGRGGKNVGKSVKGKKIEPVKEATVSKKGRPRKGISTESSSSKPEPKSDAEELPKTRPKDKRKKVEEKENVIDQSIMEEVQNIKGEDSAPETNESSPAKKRKASSKKNKEVEASPQKVLKKSKIAFKGEPDPNLPEGWRRIEVIRKSGSTVGKTDVYYFSPEGIKFRSRPDVAAYIARTKSKLKLEDFSFRAAKPSSESPEKKPAKKEKASLVSKQKLTGGGKKKTSSPTKKNLVVKLNIKPKRKTGKKVASPKEETKQPAKSGKTQKAVGKKNQPNS